MDFTLSRLRNTITRLFQEDNKQTTNKFNDAFLYGVGGGFTAYDPENRSYIEYGYKINPLVYIPINEMATKTSVIPYYIKKVEDSMSLSKMKMIERATGFNMSPQQQSKYLLLKTRALSQSEMPLPLEQPNPNQSWTEFIALYKTMIKLTGNVYFYTLAPEEGMQADEPKAIYILPSQNIEIIVKDNLTGVEIDNPIRGYILTYGASYIEFESKNVIHIKYSNPEYGENGEHLYGVSPLRTALKNIQSSNTSLDLNIKTLKNGGAFGFIHSKTTPMTEAQAAEIKERLLEMDSNTENLSKIAGVSADIGFTRLSLTSDELKPFDYLGFDEKMISGVLNWALDDGSRGDYGGTISEIRKMRITDNIVPDLELFTEAINKYWLPRFKGYENMMLFFDVTELPEMQVDTDKLTGWLNGSLDRGVVTRNEYRLAISYPEIENDDMDRLTVASDVISLEESLDNDFQVPQK